MDKEIIRNVPRDKAIAASTLVDYQEGQVVSRTLVQNQALSLTLFAFDRGEGLSSHTTPGEALIMVLDGEAEITVDEEVFRTGAGEIKLLPASVPHAVHAPERMKMLLTLVKQTG